VPGSVIRAGNAVYYELAHPSIRELLVTSRSFLADTLRARHQQLEAFDALPRLRTVAHRSSVVREDLPGPYQPGDEPIALLRLDGAMFLRSGRKALEFDHCLPGRVGRHGRHVAVGMLDATGAHTLAEIAEDRESHGITVIIKGVQPEHMPCWPTWASSMLCATKTT
jgi:hypothetical protein